MRNYCKNCIQMIILTRCSTTFKRYKRRRKSENPTASKFGDDDEKSSAVTALGTRYILSGN